MKIIFCLILCWFYLQVSFSQNVVLHDPMTSRYFDSQKYTGILGSPFLFKDWIKGTVVTPKGIYQNLELKYDAYENILLFKKEDKSLEFQEDVKEFILMSNEMDSNSYQYFIKGIIADGLSAQKYIQVLSKGKIKLYKLNARLMTEVSEINQGIKKSFTNVTKYYAGAEGHIQQVNLNKKDLLPLFKDKEADVQQFIKEKSLNVKKEEDVVALVNYYNTVSQK